jgi:hypothetical protein
MEMNCLFVIARELDQNDHEKKMCFSQNMHFFSLKSIKIHYETIIYAKLIPKKNVLKKFYIP